MYKRQTAPNANYGSTLTLENLTDASLLSDQWAWGFEDGGTAVTPPIVDAGGPYSGFNNIALSGTVTPGTDPNPTLQWSIVGPAGTEGTFANGDTLTPTFTWTAITTGPIIVALTATPDDGPPVVDTAEINLVG